MPCHVWCSTERNRDAFFSFSTTYYQLPYGDRHTPASCPECSLLYNHKNHTSMKALEITRLLDSHEPLAIVRYFEWVALAKDNGTPRYALLHLNKKKNKIRELSVPDTLVSLLTSRLHLFTKVCAADGGTVWERMHFRDVVKTSIPEHEIVQWIHKN